MKQKNCSKLKKKNVSYVFELLIKNFNFGITGKILDCLKNQEIFFFFN